MVKGVVLVAVLFQLAIHRAECGHSAYHCLAGSTPNADNTGCVLCPAGKFSQGERCDLCAAGMLLKHAPETLLESNSVCMHPQPHDPQSFDTAGKHAPVGSGMCATCEEGTYKGCGTSGIRGESVLLASEDHLPRLRPKGTKAYECH